MFFVSIYGERVATEDLTSFTISVHWDLHHGNYSFLTCRHSMQLQLMTSRTFDGGIAWQPLPTKFSDVSFLCQLLSQNHILITSPGDPGISSPMPWQWHSQHDSIHFSICTAEWTLVFQTQYTNRTNAYVSSLKMHIVGAPAPAACSCDVSLLMVCDAAQILWFCVLPCGNGKVSILKVLLGSAMPGLNTVHREADATHHDLNMQV